MALPLHPSISGINYSPAEGVSSYTIKEAKADLIQATNIQCADGVAINKFETTLTPGSDTKVPTSKAIDTHMKGYVPVSTIYVPITASWDGRLPIHEPACGMSMWRQGQNVFFIISLPDTGGHVHAVSANVDNPATTWTWGGCIPAGYRLAAGQTWRTSPFTIFTIINAGDVTPSTSTACLELTTDTIKLVWGYEPSYPGLRSKNLNPLPTLILPERIYGSYTIQ